MSIHLPVFKVAVIAWSATLALASIAYQVAHAPHASGRPARPAGPKRADSPQEVVPYDDGGADGVRFTTTEESSRMTSYLGRACATQSSYSGIYTARGASEPAPEGQPDPPANQVEQP